ncbi:twin-arginine translocation signal domain-containing protein [Oceanisphaera sp.]|uniref:twin-arginine translocation signal domain-containing protein n=1 Tax=Oceanisphaera sp. TaxID=1929979 RepID=UPI003A8E7AF0
MANDPKNKGDQPSRGLHELYAEDPIKADELVWNRETDANSRRGFLKRGGLLAMATAIGASIPFSKNMPAGLIPAAFAQSDEPFAIPGKEGLTILNDRPLNAETPPHLLDDEITPGQAYVCAQQWSGA